MPHPKKVDYLVNEYGTVKRYSKKAQAPAEVQRSLQKSSSHKRVNTEVVKKVLSIRRQMPRLGTRKLHYLLTQDQPCCMGRDALFGFLRAEGLLVKKKRCYQKTTDSRHWLRKYKDLHKELELTRPEQFWVADITYVSLQQGFCYFHLVSDAYSKQILGYQVSDTLEASYVCPAFTNKLLQAIF